MTLVAAAVVPSTPLLAPELAGAAVARDEALRERVRATVAALLDGPEDVVVVGAAPTTGRRTGTWDFAGFGLPRRPAVPASERLPLALAVGARLLDDADAVRTRTFCGVHPDDGPQACAALGVALVSERPVRLLVVGDGTARRSEKAPGHLDDRAERYDLDAERALRAGDPGGLLALDPVLGGELLASGRAAWQVLAGAASGRGWTAEQVHAEAPYGVAYLVATWRSA